MRHTAPSLSNGLAGLLVRGIFAASQLTVPALLVALQTVSASPAFAQNSGDDDGDDDDGGGGGGGGGGAAAGAGEVGSAADNGDTPDDGSDCFAEATLRPVWARECQRPVAVPRKPVVRAAPVATATPPRPVRPPARTARPSVDEPFRVIPREVVMLGVSEADIARLVARGFAVIVRSPGPVAGGTLVRLRVPADATTEQGRSLAREIAPGALSDYNHIYGVFRLGSGRCDTTSCKQRASVGWPPNPSGCALAPTVGIVDTSVDLTNPALAGQSIDVVDVVASGRQAASPAHGTALAALFVARPDASVSGLLPKSRVVAVAAFHKASDGEDIADTFDVVTGIDALVKRAVRVVNASFTGPDNQILKKVVVFARDSGSVVVAAVGNAGPGSAPLYPAAYDEAVAVTAVGADLRVYGKANRGQHVDFSAPGVDVQVVSVRAEPRFETGTSFAAPFVSAALAAALAAEPGQPIAKAVADLQSAASDLGAPGRDPVYGWGLLQARNVCK